MTVLSRRMDEIILDVIDNKYQLATNPQGKALLKIDLEDIFDVASVAADNQAEYIRNLEEELQYTTALLQKFEGKE